jgi:hypothetical protein
MEICQWMRCARPQKTYSDKTRYPKIQPLDTNGQKIVQEVFDAFAMERTSRHGGVAQIAREYLAPDSTV